MARTKQPADVAPIRPAINPDVRVSQAIAMAEDLALQQLRDGTASSQVITHYLKLAAEREKSGLELERMREENKLLRAKTEQIQSQRNSGELYEQAMQMYKIYAGKGDPDDYNY